jgi:CheY-like chemotaxis protein
MDGIEATKIIRGMGYESPIVALTANAVTGQEELFLGNGFDDYISKPIDIRQLNSVLNKLIRDKQPQEVLDEARRQRNILYASGKHHIAVDAQLSEFFIRDAEKAVKVLDAICKNKCRRVDDIPILIINIHSMKSALANVGESELSEEASHLEQAGREHNVDLVLSVLPDFLKSMHEVIDKLKPADNEDSGTEDVPFLNEKLAVIQKACASFDKKTAKDALNELKQRTWSKSTRDKLSAITEHLLHSEFDEAAALSK